MELNATTTQPREQASEEARWEHWAEHEARVAYRSERHGLVFYDAGTKIASKVAWLGRAALASPVAAPEAPTDNLGIALFVLRKPGGSVELKRGYGNLPDYIRTLYQHHPDAEITMVRSWADSAGCQHAEDAREYMRSIDEDLQAASANPAAFQQIMCEHCGGTGGHWAGCAAPIDPAATTASASEQWTAEEIADACVKAGLGVLEANSLIVTLKGTGRAKAPSRNAAPLSNLLGDLLGQYWEIAYSEGKTGESRGSEAQAVLSKILAALTQQSAASRNTDWQSGYKTGYETGLGDGRAEFTNPAATSPAERAALATPEKKEPRNG